MQETICGEGDSVKNRAELLYVGVSLTGLILLAIAYVLWHESPSFTDAAAYVVAALVLVVWAVMGVRTSRRNTKEAADREQRKAEEQLRKEAEEAARRAVDVVNTRRTISHGGTTINVRRRGATDQGQGN